MNRAPRQDAQKNGRTTVEVLTAEIGRSEANILRKLDDISKEQVANEHLNARDDKLLHAFTASESAFERVLTEKLDPIIRHLDSAVQWGQIAPLIPSKPYVNRLLDHVDEKIEIAKFVIDRFFVKRRSKQMCFVQASAMGFRFFSEFAANESVPHFCLFHVNGPIAPLPLQFSPHFGHHSVVPFWGSKFDTNCCAYLPPSNDEQAVRELQDLFLRVNEPLHIAFVTPRYVTPDGRLYFEREETAHFVDAIADALVQRDNVELVAMISGDRVRASIDEIPDEHRQYVALTRTLAHHKTMLKYIVSSSDSPNGHLAESLRSCVGKLCWQGVDRSWVDDQVD